MPPSLPATGESEIQERHGSIRNAERQSASLTLVSVAPRDSDSDSYIGFLESAKASVDSALAAVANPYRSPLFWSSVASMLVVGGINPIISKWGFLQQSSPCPPFEDCPEQYYEGFMAISVVKYAWQSLIGAVLYYGLDIACLFKRGKKPIFAHPGDIIAHKKHSNTKIIAILCITAIFDSAFTVFERSATSFIPASVVAAIASTQIIVAAIADVSINRRATLIGEMIGLSIIIAGLVVYSYGVVQAADDSEHSRNPALGALLALVSSFSRGFHSSLQGKYMAKLRMPPLKTLLIESSICLVYCLILAGILSVAGLYSIIEEFWMVCNNWRIMMSVQLFGFFCIGFNGGATVAGKFVSGLFRIILTRFASFFVWIIELSIGWASFTWIILTGWVTIITGVIIFGGALSKTHEVFLRPLTCKCLIPPANAKLSARQKARISEAERKQDSGEELSPMSPPSRESTSTATSQSTSNLVAKAN